ncbi:MAG TPA: polyphosphate kinase 2 family protein [Thermoanaerobaculia bacterium]|jgi:PPK2 family polyphosphate:nucleotide phosphotransferase|nr:polyphosphate kinase 2 family protein [Thermoanaerobaculia bacterium]
MIKHHRVEPGTRFRVDQVDAGSTAGFAGGKRKTAKVFADLNQRLHGLQNLLWAEHDRRVLVVLQGMDTSGKDGTISHVFQGVNPLGVRVAAFRAPSPEELDHDFLWRVHAKVPCAGELAIFNRSHYEAVLVERVHKLVPAKVWKARYGAINDFERLLVENRTTVLKFFLHIDRDEQRKRLEERLADPEKRWKWSSADLEDRKRWDDFMAAYEEAISRTSTDEAPWFVVPANKKWYRNLVVATVLVEALEGLQLHYREPEVDLRRVKIE